MYGRIIIGHFQADTLVYGIRIDSLGTYAGQFNRHMMASGHGSYQAADGTYYEGHWERDCRNGFGFSVSPTNLKAGIWRMNRFKGEHVVYTTERIYGIDISRYQHEKGRRRFGINWKQLRISGLGRRISQKRIKGDVDYPVSFVYIKSTEGISIQNRYFSDDYKNCHQYNIPVGAYHFFSTKQDPKAQANHFLKNTSFKRGDLPPMLDIEPTDFQIEQMGGVDILFKNIRIWLKIVEKRVGVKPLLYINQKFVNERLHHAPDLKNEYHFWIARYGEYKPDIHLSIWQLSGDGRVKGIQSEVDLNVFNGYQGQWDDFLREQCIR
jgi:lysozyme